ncbi:argininosuccinate lyase [Terriglobus sp.]|uniref:argininosuccinate lyase n=1 Tax=Terriglobus sp. TaxID=1889013 RepID=UPI003B00505B
MANEASKMWSGRFREPLNPSFEQWQRSFPFDWRLIPQEAAASKAHALMLESAGILTHDESQQIKHALDALKNELREQQLDVTSSLPEDVHHFVELELTKRIGTVALKLHTGRSRNEQIATDLRLYVRDTIDRAIEHLATWADALLTLAASAGEAVMPGYTHLQRAEPVLVAHWLLAYVEMVLRDCSRLEDARDRLNQCPLGSGAIAGATLALDRNIAAEELGFNGPTLNSMDATSDRDFALEFAQVASVIGLHLSRFAEEITIQATQEFGFVDLPEAFSTGSSAMPQKKNPDFTELLRGKSGRLAGAVVTLSTIVKGLPLAYNKDMQETQEAVFGVADTLDGMLPLLAPFTSALRFRFDRMQAAADSGYLNAMAAATYLVHKGVPFRTAHEKVGKAVRLGLETGRELQQLATEELQQFGLEFGSDFAASVTTAATLDCHDVIGGTARALVAQALASARERVASLRSREPSGTEESEAYDARS